VMAGEFVNTATANATDPNGDPVSGTDEATVVYVAPGQCAFSVGYWFNNPNVVWPFDVTVGGLTFTQAEGQAFWPARTTVDRAFTQYAAVQLSEVDLSTEPELAAAMAVIDNYFATRYPNNPNREVQQAAGFIGDWISANTCDEGPPPPGMASIDLKKSANPTTYTMAGEVITYTFVVTNDGTVTLSNVTVVDPLFNLTFGPIASLAPTASETFTYDYTITSADVAAGSIVNTATASGTFDNVAYTDSDTATVTYERASLALSKTATPETFTAAGQTITYTFTVTNTGTVTLYEVTIDDPLVAVLGGPIAELAPGAVDSTTFTATYVITPDDVITGSVRNVATAQAWDSNNTAVSGTDEATVVYVGDGQCSFSQGYWFSKPGVVWPFDVTVGGLTFTQEQAEAFWPAGTTVDKAFTQYATITLSEVDLGAFPELAAAMAVIDDYFASTYPNSPNQQVQQAAGFIGDWVDANHCGEDAEAWGSIRLTKSANPTTYTAMGELITFTFTVENTGEAALDNVVIDDPLLGVSFGPVVSLAAGASATFTYAYTISAADLAAGEIVNTATATAMAGGSQHTATDSVTVVHQQASLALTKIADPMTYSAAGQAISYTFRLENTGTVTLYDVNLSDLLPGLELTGGPIGELGPGAIDNTTFTATYVITESDVTAGSVVNTATAEGWDPENRPVTAMDEVTVLYEGSGQCAFSQGYWFGKPEVVWPFDVEVGGWLFTQADGQAFWPVSTTVDKAFTQYAAMQLSGVDLAEYPELAAAMAIIDAYFASSYPAEPGQDVQAAAGLIGDWIEANPCD